VFGIAILLSYQDVKVALVPVRQGFVIYIKSCLRP
jgi:hypothetical protein